MRMLRPASGEAEASAKLAPDCLEDGLRTGLEEEASDVFAEGGGLVGGCGGALADILHTIYRTDAGFEYEFAAFCACPCAEGDLTAAL